MKNALLLLAVSGILFAGCDKDSAFGGKPVGNRTDRMINNKWRQTGLIEIGVNVELKQCQLDNIWVFNADGTGYMDEGATKCGETPVDTTTPPSADDTTIIVSRSTGTAGNADNIQYDADGRRISFTWEVPGDQRELIIYNFGSSDNDMQMEFEDDGTDERRIKVRGSEYRNGKLIPYFKTFEVID
ncbi:MAG: hypothetical protein JNL72_09570 [Flavipsychrobacter sp.]|nr:hypothetical protein [Flavipsychrobacter sp.]